MMKKGLFAIGLVLVAATAYADNPDPNDIHLGEPTALGTGCPNGVSATLSPDAKTLSIYFDSYVAETAPGKKMVRKACSVGIPVHVPQGFSVSLIKADYRGAAYVPGNKSSDNARFDVEYFFAGHQGPSRWAVFPKGYDDGWLVTDNLQIGAIVWSNCGDDVILRSNSSLTARKSSYYGEETYIALDSADFMSKIEYKLQWKSCNN